MLEGIEILAQTDIMQKPDWAYIIFSIGMTSIVIGFIILIIGAGINRWKVVIFGLIFIVVSFVVTFFICTIAPKEPTGRYEYQVTIGDNVSFTEFYEKYEVIDQNGKIWTIREK